jgi:DNA-3-methyladenine glycosylase II
VGIDLDFTVVGELGWRVTKNAKGAIARTLSTVEIEEIRSLLSGMDEVLAIAHAAVEPFEWRIRQFGFVGLVRMIIGQQVSVAAADAIWKRIQLGVGNVTSKNVIKLDVKSLQSFGLSRPKATYVLGIAEAESSGAISFAHLAELRDEEAIERLTALKGVGRWTAEVYLMFCEGRTDLFPAGDLALQEGFRLAARKRQRPTEKDLYARAERWRPNRGVAANLLWSYYRDVRSGKVFLPNPKLARPAKKGFKKKRSSADA